MSKAMIEEIESFISIHKNLSREDILQYLARLKTNYKRPSVRKKMQNKINRENKRIEILSEKIELAPSKEYDNFLINGKEKVVDTSQEEILGRKKKYPIVSSYTKEVIKDQREFLKSKHWQCVKRMYIRSIGHNKKECEKCGRKTNLNLHHLTYKNMGNEKANELMYLCSKCHCEVHEREFTTFKDQKKNFRDVMIAERRNEKENIEIQIEPKFRSK